MRLLKRIFRTLFGDRDADDIAEELEFHLAMDAASGRGRREARRRLGHPRRIDEDTRAARIVPWLHSALQDARYGARQLRRTPVLTAAVVLSLGIGIGANGAIFSLVDSAVLKPLPVHDAERLLLVEWTHDGSFPDVVTGMSGRFFGTPTGGTRGSSIGAGLYRQLAREGAGFEALAGFSTPVDAAVSVGAAPAEQPSLQFVSANFFRGLGVDPVVGRFIIDDDDRAGQTPAVVVSHRFWKTRLGGSGDALERDMRVNGVPARIVGVAPPGFFGVEPGQWTDVYAPLAARAALEPPGTGPDPADDGYWWVQLIGRLAPDVEAARAERQLDAAFASVVAEAFPGMDTASRPTLVTLPGRRGQTGTYSAEADALWFLQLLVGVLLAIVCANVANLLLSRAVGRQRESAVRLALGAGRLRLLRQHLIEGSLLALLGAAAGLVFGYVLAQSLHDLYQIGRGQSSAFALGMDARTLGYTAAVTVVTALGFGLAPAIRAARADVHAALKNRSRTLLGGRLGLPRLLVSVQFGLCLAALAAAGLLGRSLENLGDVDIGVERAHLVYATVNPRSVGYPAERVGPFLDDARAAIEALPGVERVAMLNVRIAEGGGSFVQAFVPGRPAAEGFGDGVYSNRIGDGAVEALGMTLLAGRALTAADMRRDSRVAIVGERFVDHFFEGGNALGRRFGFGGDGDEYEIVGVVRDTRYQGLRDGTLRPTVYLPYAPGAPAPTHFAIRARLDADALAGAVRAAVASIDPSVPVVELHTQSVLIDRMLRAERLLAAVSRAFGLVAVVLAAIGLGGLLTYAVAQRTGEIGVRMALGAGSTDVTRMILRDSLRMAGAGMLVGLPLVYGVGRMLESSLFGLAATDPATTAVAAGILTAVAVAAAAGPARRAARVEPMTALRDD